MMAMTTVFAEDWNATPLPVCWSERDIGSSLLIYTNEPAFYQIRVDEQAPSNQLIDALAKKSQRWVMNKVPSWNAE